MAQVPTVASIVQHYLTRHEDGRTLHDIADRLRQRTGSGSSSSISAWVRGQRMPALKHVRALRATLGCVCLDYSDAAIADAYSRASAAHLVKMV
ncbi:hypothetical protein [Polymorphospora lycopeni]|uniref:XRE family transcriptional regulator n=1 Tax=Polymorphospora lycopeni TaxID=3140240 RepID=A0ABV5CKC6_9ACTN